MYSVVVIHRNLKHKCYDTNEIIRVGNVLQVLVSLGFPATVGNEIGEGGYKHWKMGLFSLKLSFLSPEGTEDL